MLRLPMHALARPSGEGISVEDDYLPHAVADSGTSINRVSVIDHAKYMLA